MTRFEPVSYSHKTSTPGPGTARPRQHTTTHAPREPLRPPRRRGFREIPEPGAMEALIQRALGALEQGFTWDRGSILNVEV